MIYTLFGILGLLIGVYTNIYDELFWQDNKGATFQDKVKKGLSFRSKNTLFLFINALLYGLLYYKYGHIMLTLKVGLFISFLLFGVYIDFKTRLIPDSVSLGILLLGIFQNIWHYDINYTFSSVLTLLIFGLILIVFNILSKGAIGMGDVKLLTVIAFLLKINGVLTLFLISFLLGAVFGIVLLLFFKKDLKYQVPFAPIVLAGYVISIVFDFI